ncbi:BON domain-containing protein [Candidatus Methylomirabilis sp.]|uniref:BON domain-containing protein n=1 Tax=Candidatus Methylomirabilis sp. TaxID=2032687 RepID=UPI003C731964
MHLPSRTSIVLIAVLTTAVFPLLQACAPTATRESTGEYLDDSAITAKIKTKLLGDSTISGFAITVETFRGRVILAGFVNSQAQVDRAIALSREVSGVREVQSALVIKSR